MLADAPCWAQLTYLTDSGLFRRITAPLGLALPELHVCTRQRGSLALTVAERLSRAELGPRRKALKASIAWSVRTHPCLFGVNRVWATNFKRLVLIEVRYDTQIPFHGFTRREEILARGCDNVYPDAPRLGRRYLLLRLWRREPPSA